MFDAISDPRERYAIRRAFAQNPTGDLQQSKATYKDSYNKWQKGSAVASAKITATDLSPSTWHGIFGTGKPGITHWSEMSDEAKTAAGNRLTKLFREHSPKFDDDYVADGADMLDVMRRNGYIVDTSSGPVGIPPEIQKQYRTESGQQMSTQEIGESISKIRDIIVGQGGPDAVNTFFGGRELDPDDIQFDVVGNMLVGTALDRDGNTLGQEVFSPDEMRQVHSAKPPLEMDDNLGALIYRANIRNGNSKSTTSILRNGGSFPNDTMKAASIKSIYAYEANFDTLRDNGTGDGALNIGPSITETTGRRMMGDAWFDSYKNVANNPSSPEYARMTDQFMEKYFEPMSGFLSELEITDTSWEHNGKDMEPVITAVANAMYQGGSASRSDAPNSATWQYMDLLKRAKGADTATRAQLVNEFNKGGLAKASKVNSDRAQMYRNAILYI